MYSHVRPPVHVLLTHAGIVARPVQQRSCSLHSSPSGNPIILVFGELRFVWKFRQVFVKFGRLYSSARCVPLGGRYPVGLKAD